MEAFAQRRIRANSDIAQVGENLVEESKGPVAIINQIRAKRAATVELELVIHFDLIKRNCDPTAATFDCGGIAAGVGDEVLEAKPAERKRRRPFSLAYGWEILVFQNQGEKALRIFFRLPPGDMPFVW